MGKRTRRKRQTKGNNNSGKQQQPSTSSNNNNPYPHTTTTNNNKNPSVLLQRIRHADPRTRHAALAAVANTWLDITTATTTHPKLSPPLLQAIRERVMDADLDVSQVAAGCLANYVTLVAAAAASATATASSNGTTTTTTKIAKDTQAMTAGWVLVLVGRLKQCYDNVTRLLTNHNNNNNNNNQKKSSASQQKMTKTTTATTCTNPTTTSTKQQKQWFALAVQCLRTLCTLMETNPEAVGRLTLSSLDATLRHDFHQTILEWLQLLLQLGQQQQQRPQQQPSQPQFSGDDAIYSYADQILILAAQTLHSAWDDNPDLIAPWKDECPDAFQRALELLQSIMTTTPTLSSSSNTTTTNTSRRPLIPVMAQLHATGAFLNGRPFVVTPPSTQQTQTVNNNSTATTMMMTMIQQGVIPQLTHHLSLFSWTTVQSLLTQYQNACQKWKEERDDDALERDVIRQVDDRKEPARLIARRQKQQREAAAAAAAAAQEATTTTAKDDDESHKNTNAIKNDTAMMDDDDDDDDAKMEEDNHDTAKNNNNAAAVMETREALEQARGAWNDFLMPLQLSLELLANLTSSSTGGGNNNHDGAEEDETMMDDDWGPDQEAQWMLEQQQQQQHCQKTTEDDDALQKVLIESPLPQQLLQLFRQVYQLPHIIMTSTTPTSTMHFPEQSLHELEDLQSKTAACLGNCWETIPSWPLQDVSWAELQQMAVTANKGLGKEGLVSTMVIALKQHRSLRKEWKPEHLAFWLQELQQQASQEEDRNSKDTDKQQQQQPIISQSNSSSSIQRDVISMLGILCSQEPHPVEVDQQVCTTLLSLLANNSVSGMIQCEILNVLMDMYGNDDDGCCHQSVFESLHVLGHFQRCIPDLKSKLRQQEKKLQSLHDNGGADRIELEQWKETVLNASRFVQYKKGQL